MKDMWDTEFELLAELERKEESQERILAKNETFYGNSFEPLLLDYYFEKELLHRIEEKVQMWKTTINDEEVEKRQLRYKFLIEEFQILQIMIWNQPDDLDFDK